MRRLTKRRPERVVFEPAPPTMGGSTQHYAHFLWGYLAPTMGWLGTAEVRPRSILVGDCGPHMNPCFDFVTGSGVEEVDIRPQAELARLARRDPHIVGYRFDRAADHDLRLLLDAHRFGIGQLSVHAPCVEAEQLKGQVVVIRRSPSPAFYAQGGPAEISTYGTDRRAITNTAEIAELLNDRGLSASVFEPGAHSLACQVFAFGNAAGVVGQRGADLANVLWMNAAQFLVMFSPQNMSALPGVTAGIATAMGIPTVTLPMAETHGAVSATTVLRVCRALAS